MTVRKYVVPVTTAADGTATVYSPFLSGYIHSITYLKTDFADGVDFTITVNDTGETVWTEANVNAAKVCLPRMATHSNAGVAALYASGGTAVQDRLAIGRDKIKIVIAQGGNAKSGTFVIVADDGK